MSKKYKAQIISILAKKLLPLFQEISESVTLLDAHNKVSEYEEYIERELVNREEPQEVMQNVYDAIMNDLYHHMQDVLGGENEDVETLANLANSLDKKGFYEEANEIDAILVALAGSDSVPTNKDLWEKAKAAAKRKYKVWPSAYASAFAAKWYKDKGGGWKKKKKKKKKSEMILSLIATAKKKKMKGGLGEWFREEWVDISRKDKDGKHPPCGRDKAKANPSKYPKCRPKSEAKNMSKKEKQNAVKEKRRKEKKNPKKGKGNKPTRSNHKKRD